MPIVKNKTSVVLEGLKVVREHLEIPRPKLLKVLGRHSNTLANIENHSKATSLVLANKIAEVLCCKLEDITSIPTVARLSQIKREFHLKEAGLA